MFYTSRCTRNPFEALQTLSRWAYLMTREVQWPSPTMSPFSTTTTWTYSSSYSLPVILHSHSVFNCPASTNTLTLRKTVFTRRWRYHNLRVVRNRLPHSFHWQPHRQQPCSPTSSPVAYTNHEAGTFYRNPWIARLPRLPSSGVAFWQRLVRLTPAIYLTTQ